MLATFFQRHCAAGAAAVLFLVAVGTGPATFAAGTATAGVQHLRCTNDKSGASWDIAVDLDHNQVDSEPATINDTWISWPDPKQGYFDLERATGKLQFRNASSTGGYFLYYTCQPE